MQVFNTIIIGVTPTTSLIFNEEFPDLQKVAIEPYNISYSKYLPLSLKLIFDAPHIVSVIKKEHKQLQQIIKKYKIDVVISDNRFGLYNKEVESIYITHQLNIQAGILSAIANKIHHRYIKNFNQVWVPDFENESESLAGNLSQHKRFVNAIYLGSLSRLVIPQTQAKKFDYLFLISGPEPHRTQFENLLIEIANKSMKKIALVRGTKTDLHQKVNSNMLVYNSPTSIELSELISSSETIICRSGYSTLMDLFTLKNTNCILVPTQSQTEQEYLAYYWNQKFNCKVVQQRDLLNLVI